MFCLETKQSTTFNIQRWISISIGFSSLKSMYYMKTDKFTISIHYWKKSLAWKKPKFIIDTTYLWLMKPEM